MNIVKRNLVVGMCRTEAWADIHHLNKDTKVSVPSSDAVIRAKDWVEENQK